MEDFPCLRITDRDILNCELEVEFNVENVMESPCSIYFLDRSNNRKIEYISEKYPDLKQLTHLKIELLPSEFTQGYYSLKGIESIISQLFKIRNTDVQKDLKERDVFIKVYYRRDDFFTIPIICIEIFFLKELQPKTIKTLNKILTKDIIYLVGCIGDIDIKKISSSFHLKEYLKIPLLVGEKVYKMEGIYERNNFTKEQLNDLNLIHGVSLIKLDMERVINNNEVSIFDEIRIKNLPSEDFDEYREEEINDVIKCIFQDDNDDFPL